MAVHRPSQKERQASKAGTTESAFTKGRTTHGYIDSSARPTPTHSLQSTIRRIQGRSTNTPEAKTGNKRYQQLRRSHHIGSLPSPHRRP